MKTIILTLSLLIAGCTICFAQCGKKVTLTTSKTEHLDANGIVTRTVDEKAVVEINKSALNINVNDEHKMTGVIKSDTCDWKVPFKDGKMVLKATIGDENGDDKNVTITIEGKDGKVTLLFEMEGMPDDRIKVTIDKFEEVS
jgi:hypothetical protein